jgi:hypothetical protein
MAMETLARSTATTMAMATCLSVAPMKKLNGSFSIMAAIGILSLSVAASSVVLTGTGNNNGNGNVGNGYGNCDSSNNTGNGNTNRNLNMNNSLTDAERKLKLQQLQTMLEEMMRGGFISNNPAVCPF